ncbi:hypothetical protein GcM1_249093 [Golovinomyces cichoracearum]|uniref:Uncharacterized protein n=1 Tax=Golovinomyces cichoracearum TaxID=62708 RepID=A0A420IBU7_9PEZI|nr:hypothetical protein GcM1_249093 [Golovinomyces cichoracearum]
MVDVEGFRIAFQSQFQNKEQGDLHAEIGGLDRGAKETLIWCYERARELLRRSYRRDLPTDDNSALAPIEVVVLGNIVTAFVRGVKNNRFRSIVLVESMNNAGSLLKINKK